jgi:hypothetical protein
MSNDTKNGETVKTVSKADYETLCAALTRGFPIVKATGSAPGAKNDLAESFDKADAADIRACGLRMAEAVIHARKSQREESLRGVRVAIRGVVAKKLGVYQDAIKAYAALAAEVRALIPAPPSSHFFLPVKDLLPAFPKGTTVEQAALLVKELGEYEGAKGAQGDDGPRIKVTIAPAPGAAVPAPEPSSPAVNATRTATA